MKKYLLIPLALFALKSSGQSFNSTATNWGCPNGGMILSGTTYGYNNTGGASSSGYSTGSQTWGIMDMNGDGKVDLVVTGQMQAGNVTSFSPTSGQYWKVYLNSGSGFSTTATNWTCPNGGEILSGTTYGYNSMSGTSSSGYSTGSQTWTTMDMNGDGKPDLVVSGQMQAGNVTSFSPTSGQYWKVYLNSGSGFSTTATNWACPNGGEILSGTTYGYNAVGGYSSSGYSTGSQTWNTMDMNGDGKPDLVVSAQMQAGNVTSFSPTSGQYWKVYLNSGSGFSTTATNWTCPNGGIILSGTTYGYDNVGGSSSSGYSTGSQSWSTMDMNGDGKVDLVVTAQMQAGNVTSFSPTSGQYWKVYLNSGSGFSTTATNWTCPNGGEILSGTTYGYNSASGYSSSGYSTGSQTWTTIDLTGDGKPELVVSGQMQAGNVTSFSPTSGQYWKIYANSGSGFSTTATNWSCPNGGEILSGTTYGYNSIGGVSSSGYSTGSQTWGVADMNGDNRLDLVVSGQMQGGNVTSFSPTSGQYWKVYLGSATSGVFELEALTGLSVYPNPTDNILYINSEKMISKATIEVYDVVGKVIFKKQIDKFNSELIDVSDLVNGIYFVRVIGTDGELSETKRIVKQ